MMGWYPGYDRMRQNNLWKDNMPRAAAPKRAKSATPQAKPAQAPPELPEQTLPEPEETPEEPPEAPAPQAAPKAAPRARKAPASDDGWFAQLDDVEQYVNALYYGREGSTKTTCAAAASRLPGNGRVLVINAEGGLKKVALKSRGINTARIVQYPNPATGEVITRDGLLKVYRTVASDLANDPSSWDAVVFDSITEIAAQLLGGIANKRTKFLIDSGKTNVDPDFVDRSDYGTLTKMLRDVLRKFRDLPCHFVCTALERRDVDEDTAKVAYGPAITPALATDLVGYVDIVLMTKAPDESGPARALSGGNSRFRAKDRFGVLPRVLAEPTFDRVVAYTTGELTEATDPVQATLATDNDKKS